MGLEEIVRILAPVIGIPGLLIVLLLFFPEKIEKWSALLWLALSKLGYLFNLAHQRYVKHDLQGRVNSFVKNLRRAVPDIGDEKLKIEWVDPAVERKSFIADGKVVIRLRREDPEDNNFVHGAFLYISGTLLRKPKRYLSLSQRRSIDLFVCTKLIEAEKPSVVGFFLDEYLHPQTENKKSKIALYLDDFAQIHRGGLFFSLFVQELQYLGDKVFGRRRDDLIVNEVNGLTDFLKDVANRPVGDEGDLNFDGDYCKFGIVIIGRPQKLLASIQPYITYIENQLVKKGVETIYLLSRGENRRRVDQICELFLNDYYCMRRFRFRGILRHRHFEELAPRYLVVMRRKEIGLIQASSN